MAQLKRRDKSWSVLVLKGILKGVELCWKGAKGLLLQVGNIEVEAGMIAHWGVALLFFIPELDSQRSLCFTFVTNRWCNRSSPEHRLFNCAPWIVMRHLTLGRYICQWEYIDILEGVKLMFTPVNRSSPPQLFITYCEISRTITWHMWPGMYLTILMVWSWHSSLWELALTVSMHYSAS